MRLHRCLLVCAAALAAPATFAGDLPFRSMAQPEDTAPLCAAPRPPQDLAEKAVIRNALREVLRILSYEEALRARSCACPFETVDWRRAAQETGRFDAWRDASDNPDVPALRRSADALELLHIARCGG